MLNYLFRGTEKIRNEPEGPNQGSMGHGARAMRPRDAEDVRGDHDESHDLPVPPLTPWPPHSTTLKHTRTHTDKHTQPHTHIATLCCKHELPVK